MFSVKTERFEDVATVKDKEKQGLTEGSSDTLGKVSRRMFDVKETTPGEPK